MKKIIKKWWFWLIVIVLLISIILIIKEYREQKKIKETMKTIGESALDYYNGIQTAEGYGQYFTYNYETGEVEYHPPITIEKYDEVREGMTEKEVISILGNGEKLQPEGANGFLMTWGDLNLTKYPYYRIQIVFNASGVVENKSQMGLK